MIILQSNEYWGRRSGVKNAKTKEGVQNIFRQMQFASGKSGAGKPFNTKLINVPRKWFGKSYKSKRS